MAKHAYAADPSKPHIRAYYTLLDSPAWCALPGAAKALWIDLRRQIGATNNGTATTSIKVLRHRGWKTRHTVQHAAEALEALGFIRCTIQGGIANGGKLAKLWAFTDVEVFEQRKYGIPAAKPTSDFATIKTLTEARAVIRDLEASREQSKENRKVQKLHRLSAETAPEKPESSAETAHDTIPPVQKLHTEINVDSSWKTAP